jgi:hypothetical protein
MRVAGSARNSFISTSDLSVEKSLIEAQDETPVFRPNKIITTYLGQAQVKLFSNERGCRRHLGC